MLAAEDEASFQARLADPAVTVGIPVLVDATEIEPADSVERVHCMAERVARNASRLKCGPTAIVVSSDVEYGMARMYMALTDQIHPQTNVFRDTNEALEWLRSAAARLS
ncbi:MAG: hypothetical protein P1P84_13995 [Deferrisomatales bacterium]|nr:hypothetical protein [Deferrisomatales bacterium]